MMIIRDAQAPAQARLGPGDVLDADPLQVQAARVFADDLATDQIPSVRAIRAALRVGHPRAQRLREFLATAAETPGGNPRVTSGRRTRGTVRVSEGPSLPY
jgi:hypothetical protein